MRIWVILLLILCAGCTSRQQQLEYFSQLLCDCGEPVVAWKRELPANPASMNNGGVIEVQLRDCLQEGAEQFQQLASDTVFIFDLASSVNNQCPEINTSLNAMLLILAGQK